MRNFNLITIRNERQFRAFTGLPETVFNRLLPVFTQCLESTQQRHYKKDQAHRQRRPGGGRKGALSTPELKLFFLLFYLKNYPTFDVLGSLFDLSPSKANEQVKKLLPVLKEAERRLQVLPHRHFKPTLSKTAQPIENKNKIIVDATERPLCRPHHARKQKHYYSGKGHRHTLKNTLVANAHQGIQVVGPTVAGRQHDYASFKKEFNPDQPGLSSVSIWVDTGYQGIEKDYSAFQEIHIPHKKPRKSKSNPNPKLTPKQKKENQVIGRFRVGVEHLIGDIKAFQIMAIKFRNRISNMADQLILVVAGLCNLKNSYVVQ